VRPVFNALLSRLLEATGQRDPTGTHPFDKAGTGHAIDHRRNTPPHPHTNSMVERFD
jgi:hypothetical protein